MAFLLPPAAFSKCFAGQHTSFQPGLKIPCNETRSRRLPSPTPGFFCDLYPQFDPTTEYRNETLFPPPSNPCRRPRDGDLVLLQLSTVETLARKCSSPLLISTVFPPPLPDSGTCQITYVLPPFRVTPSVATPCPPKDPPRSIRHTQRRR